ncbi:MULTISPECIES: hypothetical protein [Vibrio]|uniref:hypothetical protein n=1 Tax=Vibrio TaxID=662 RepID=UPI00078E2A0F|nr:MULTISPECIES: hypothetical protein [Vibrio]BAU70964.1 hypothetical protein [Vibrio sp. 04Ya108]BBM67778.1 hypothetical protein VA249_44240 [Vibrio alfacsensis]BCN26949.1 hypothetical protein VYA_41410 [Vibrio alfacsensis]
MSSDYTVDDYEKITAQLKKGSRKFKFYSVLVFLYASILLSAFCYFYLNPFNEIEHEDYLELYRSVSQVDCLPDSVKQALHNGKITHWEYFWFDDIESFGTKTKLHGLLINGSQCQG